MREHGTSEQGSFQIDPDQGAFVVHEAPTVEEAIRPRPLRIGSFYDGQPIRNDRELKEAMAAEERRVDSAYRSATPEPTAEEQARATVARAHARQVADSLGAQTGSEAVRRRVIDQARAMAEQERQAPPPPPPPPLTRPKPREEVLPDELIDA